MMFMSWFLYFVCLGCLFTILYFGKIEGEDEHEYYRKKYRKRMKK